MPNHGQLLLKIFMEIPTKFIWHRGIFYFMKVPSVFMDDRKNFMGDIMLACLCTMPRLVPNLIGKS